MNKNNNSDEKSILGMAYLFIICFFIIPFIFFGIILISEGLLYFVTTHKQTINYNNTKAIIKSDDCRHNTNNKKCRVTYEFNVGNETYEVYKDYSTRPKKVKESIIVAYDKGNPNINEIESNEYLFYLGFGLLSLIVAIVVYFKIKKFKNK